MILLILKNKDRNRDRIDELNTEQQVRLEMLSQNQNNLEVQVARIKQTIEKALGEDKCLTERVRTCEQVITIVSIFTAHSMTI